MATGETFNRWKAENCKDITIRFNVNGDADILNAINREMQSGNESRAAVLKRWIRAGIELDKKQKK